MKKIIIILIILIIGAIVISQFPTEKKEITQSTPTPTKVPVEKQELTAWFPAWDSEKAETELPPIVDKFTTYSPMLYRIQADASLGRHDISNFDIILSYARDKNIPIAPVITDESGTARIQILLNDPKSQQKFIDELIEEAKKEHYSGWSIDIEKITSKDKDKFSAFVRNMSSDLHANNLKLYMIAYGKDEDEDYDPALAHDYQVFGRYADEVQLMIYYYSNRFTPPGGQTPLKDYRSVLNYALENVPKEKILIGLSTYGNDWGEGNKVEGMSYQQVEKRILEETPDITYDQEELSMVAKYTKDDVDHTLMYENAMTITEKMRIAREEFGLNKFAFWSLGNEDPELWNIL